MKLKAALFSFSVFAYTASPHKIFRTTLAVTTATGSNSLAPFFLLPIFTEPLRELPDRDTGRTRPTMISQLTLMKTKEI
ncbi:hypothetical protein BN1195_02972 [Chryseobacterium oranimense G311]|uniref:hypothetical protein n=1 Tax=Chryseobacterium oranimense TaxID=421058 RepID=UPI0005338C38|nr:hypothetical protein [Chryseobacterium oranimense]CEJ70644.1 hypothetical protein BN1195_02972 [Chryseobacterium oranimense G311]